ncbi:MAG: EF-hand domain-containing protein [Colwellia sp.]|nr:EF-hand domain-containing protein [Colwellia sp.]
MINNISSGGYSAMMQGMQNRMQPNIEQMTEDLLSVADTDSNGSISKSEFSAMFTSEETSDSNAISGLFTEMDTDGDEAISVAEATDAVSNLLQQLQQQRMSNANMPPPPPPGNAEDLMSSADSDESGSLSIDEFTAALTRSEDDDESILTQMFAETDIDGDGLVSQAELNTAMEKKQGSQPQRSFETTSTSTSETNTDNNKVSMLVNSLLQQYQQNSQSIASNESLSIVA